MKQVGNIYRAFFFIVIISVAIFASNGLASTVDILPVKDNTLYEDGAGALSNGSGSHFFAGKTNFSNVVRRAVIAFNVSDSIPSGAVITNVSLRLNMSRTTATAQTINLHRLTSDWGEGTSNAFGAEGGGIASTASDATWIHTFFNGSFWTLPGGDFAFGSSGSQSVVGIGPYTFGSTAQMIADVQDWVDNPANDFGWILIGNEAANRTTKRFDSRENGIAANRPILTVTFDDPPPPPVPTLFPFILDDELAAACAGTGTGASGFGLAILSPDSTNLSFFVTHDVDSLTGAHVHKEEQCVSGSIVFPFSSPTSPISEGWALGSSDVTALFAGSLYVNIHSDSFPNGEIRGQIIPEPIRFVITVDEAQAAAGAGTGSFANGCAVITLSSDGSQLSVNVTHDVGSTTQGHIHLGASGVAGAPVFPFVNSDSPIAEVWALDTSDIKELYLGNHYINIHTSTFPGGEIRGQIERQEFSLIAQLDESQANAGAGTGSAAKGFGLFTLSADQRHLDAYIEHDVVTVNNAHIHLGIPGFAGPIVFPFFSFTSPIVETWNSLSFTDVSNLLDSLFYVNIHSDDFPDGEIRGQIEKKQVQYSFDLSDTLANECAGTNTGASGEATTTLKPGGKEMTIVVTHDVAMPIDAHIHRGFECVSGPFIFPFSGSTSPIEDIWYLSTADVIDLLQGELYVNIHSTPFPAGEIRGQIGSCCIGNRGDANGDGNDANVLDLTFIVDRIFRGGDPASCPDEADLNGDGASTNILDLTFIVDRIFRGGPPAGPC